MVVGIGTDLMRVDRLRNELIDSETPFFQKTYTRKEYEQAIKRSNPKLYFATRYAGKEAVFKALRIGSGCQVYFKDIEILDNDQGAPSVILHGFIESYVASNNIKEVLVSFSQDSDWVQAMAMVQI